MPKVGLQSYHGYALFLTTFFLFFKGTSGVKLLRTILHHGRPSKTVMISVMELVGSTNVKFVSSSHFFQYKVQVTFVVEPKEILDLVRY